MIRRKVSAGRRLGKGKRGKSDGEEETGKGRGNGEWGTVKWEGGKERRKSQWGKGIVIKIGEFRFKKLPLISPPGSSAILQFSFENSIILALFYFSGYLQSVSVTGIACTAWVFSGLVCTAWVGTSWACTLLNAHYTYFNVPLTLWHFQKDIQLFLTVSGKRISNLLQLTLNVVNFIKEVEEELGGVKIGKTVNGKFLVNDVQLC